ncbi:hypothetical protein GQ43DRAFT_280283 [Delitschia confertaspora ATCC 74209]|uniref:Uncharacterized protein n=1 Tax=Delitschia confertaspora ATCC 74209 TaxID=1513339 RepID=A0A9P4MU28_9PLEO|nr:hypothetical protein GQ43DRAFT_280283 [Delitschia confertaspora ATCC 74209]
MKLVYTPSTNLAQNFSFGVNLEALSRICLGSVDCFIPATFLVCHGRVRERLCRPPLTPSGFGGMLSMYIVVVFTGIME